VGADELRRLSQPSLRVSAGFLAVQWVSILALFVAAHAVVGLAAPWSVLWSVPIVLLIGTRVAALSCVIHEASHGLVAKAPESNRRVGNLAAAHWIGHSVEEFRPTHDLHHASLHETHDPDRHYYEVPDWWLGFGGLVVQDLLGATSAKRVAAMRGRQARAGARAFDLAPTAWKAACQALILGQFVWLQGLPTGLVCYAVFWLVPIFSIFPLIVRLKTVVEHYDPYLQRAGPAFFVSRTSCSNAFEDALFGVHMEYHFEHHVLPQIPYHGLKQLHRLLVERGFFGAVLGAAVETTVSGGYARFWRKLPQLRARVGLPHFPSAAPAAAPPPPT